MGKAGKQADRNSGKKSKRVEDEEPVIQADGGLFGQAQKMALGSVFMQIAPKVPDLLKNLEVREPEQVPNTEEKENNGSSNGNDSGNGHAEGDDASKADKFGFPTLEDAGQIFELLCARLKWHNGLGLVTSAEQSVKEWKAIKSLDLDWGPRAKKKGNPALDRIGANLCANLPQYMFVIFAMMILRAFLFRSFFACLPWLFLYQFVSLVLPLDKIPQVPQVPLEKCPVKFRVAATMGIHALVWLFLLYELVWQTWFFEKFLLIGVIVAHTYVVRPADA